MKFRIKIGNLIRKFGSWVCGPYWICTHCGSIKYKEAEVMCWDCGKGEMIYQGDL